MDQHRSIARSRQRAARSEDSRFFNVLRRVEGRPSLAPGQMRTTVKHRTRAELGVNSFAPAGPMNFSFAAIRGRTGRATRLARDPSGARRRPRIPG